MPRGAIFVSKAQRDKRAAANAAAAAAPGAAVSNAASFVAIAASARLLAAARKTRREIVPTGGPTLDPSELSVRRDVLLSHIKVSQARDKYCWTLPVGLIGFVLWCLGLTLHARVDMAQTVEAG